MEGPFGGGCATDFGDTSEGKGEKKDVQQHPPSLIFENVIAKKRLSVVWQQSVIEVVQGNAHGWGSCICVIFKYGIVSNPILKNYSPAMNTRIILSTAAITACISSCSMPPNQAWQQIRREGLVAFVMNEEPQANPTPSGGNAATMAQVPSTLPKTVAASGSQKPAVNQTKVGPAIPPIPPIDLVGPTAVPLIPTAPLAEGMVGYVRSPHTNPGRLVDVRGMSPGSKVVCPYTQKPFLVPSPAPLVADKPAAPQKPATPSTPAVSQPKPMPTPQPAPSVAATEPKTTPPPSSPVVEPKPTPQVAANSTAPAPQPEAASNLPFGMPIPGRPGFVNSPFAEKHQLVDVTGLAVGTEVKCPYSGKLFRVPPQQQAKN